MPKRILLFFLLSIGYQTLTAQDVVGCTYLLEDAKEAYAGGMVELIPELLLPCLGSDGLTGSPRREAYKLVINSYLFDHMPEEAHTLMDRFVDEYPDYRAGSTDPAEFVLLLNTNLLSKGIDPDEEPFNANVTEGDSVTARPGRERRPKVLGVSGHSLGFHAGANGTFSQLIERYSFGDMDQDKGRFGVRPGFQMGATVNFLINERFDISSGLLYNRTSLKYTATPLSSTSYEYIENGNHLQLPVSLIFKLNPESTGISYYARAGLVADYLFSAFGAGTRSSDESVNEVIVEKTDVTGSRRQINFSGMAGAGLRVPLNRSFFYTEVRFTSSILKSNRAENRYPNNDLTWLLYHVDSDFRIHQFSICTGICWNISNKEDL
ncbi:MAG: PorT family protein [Bacteroidales bacterium]|nr:PorT family protein [Bacteroidales bacterium]